jgi:hypothetical protein
LLVTPPAETAQSAVILPAPQTFRALLAMEFDITSQPLRTMDALPCTCTAWPAVLLSARMQAPRVPDPFGNLPTPSPGPKQTIPQGNNKNGLTLQPGSYTSGMNLNGNVTLSPGVYYVSGGAFYVNANAVVSGSGVTIYLAPGANVNMNGNATVNMTAPSSGTYSGVLFFGDRSGSGNNSFNGTATSSLTGDLYFPTQQVTYNGNYSGSGGCTHIVADTVSWSGNTTLAVNCASNGMPRIPSRQSVKLVE